MNGIIGREEPKPPPGELGKKLADTVLMESIVNLHTSPPVQSPDHITTDSNELGCPINSTTVLVGNVSVDDGSVRT